MLFQTKLFMIHTKRYERSESFYKYLIKLLEKLHIFRIFMIKNFCFMNLNNFVRLKKIWIFWR